MTTPDLSRLRIERDGTGGSGGTLRPRRRWLRLALIVLAIAAGGLYAARRMAAPPVVETAAVVRAWPAQNYTVLNASGYVVAQRSAAVSSKGQGRLEWLGVLEGSRVRAQEIIARLEDRDVRASQEQAAAQVNVARANLEQTLAEERDAAANLKRSTELLAKQFISGAQHDANVARADKAGAAVASARAAIAAAEASRRVAEVAVEQTLIRAPFDGIVLTKNANVGDNITPFSSATNSKGAVVTIADMNTLEVEADVSESSIARIKPGQPCDIQLDALPELRLPGVVARIVPTVDRAKATVLVKVRFAERDPRVLPDMSAKVAFLDKPVPASERVAVTAVQPAAIVEREGRKVVYLVAGEVARVAEVTPGGRIGDLVQVSGIKPGDKVVLAPPDKLRDGSPVAPAKK
jgi:RND family efflux transporter MFP subunit